MKKTAAAESCNPEDQPLRLRAEAALVKAGQAANLSTALVDVLKLMHELQVHQIELELQNEELIRAGAELEASLEKYTDLYEFAPVGYLTLDPDGRIYQMNLTAAEIFQIERSALIGRKLDSLLNQDFHPVFRDYLERVFRGSPDQHCEIQILIQNQPAVDLRLSATTMPGGDQCRLAIENITDRKQMEGQLRAALTEKEWLMREVHHRVKNNLAVIASLTDLQAKRTNDPQIQAGLRDLEQRIHTIALVHEQLYRSETLSLVDAQIYLERLIQDLSLSIGGADVQVSINASQVQLDIDKAIPLGLVVTEMVSNAFKHAFGDIHHRSGRADLIGSFGENSRAQILVSLEPEKDKLVLKVSDNGVGLPADLDWQATRTLGMRLINRLSEQLHGELAVSSQSGTCYTLIFVP